MTARPASFPRVARVVRGYDIEQVDEFVNRVLETLDEADTNQLVTAADARGIRFRWSFGGYAPGAVDQVLDDWAERLSSR